MNIATATHTATPTATNYVTDTQLNDHTINRILVT